MYWLAPNIWQRSIDSPHFSQTLIQNGEKVFEHDSDSYFPLDLRTLATALVDPLPVLDAVRPGDAVRTKANGASDESGVVCYDESHRLCAKSFFGLMETLGAAGHSVTFMNYQSFDGKRIARRLIYAVSVGDFTIAEITQLMGLRNPNKSIFAIDTPTPPERQIRIAELTEPELRNLATEKPEIIWPQVLDGAVTGAATFYVSLDTTGKVREVHPLQTANERSNDSAIRQIMRWRFNPARMDGTPVQSEGILTFILNTRAWGPKDTLDDASVRKLASNVVEPIIAPGKYPPGTEYKLWIAVDTDGIVIEKIAAGGPPDLFGTCDNALKQWHFSPLMENGEPRPYRALVVFRIP